MKMIGHSLVHLEGADLEGEEGELYEVPVLTTGRHERHAADKRQRALVRSRHAQRGLHAGLRVERAVAVCGGMNASCENNDIFFVRIIRMQLEQFSLLAQVKTIPPATLD